MEKVRVDKWLWSVRFFQTRTLAAKTCDKGHVKLNGDALKSSYKIKLGDTLSVRHNYVWKTIEVTQLIEKRVGAPIAQTCFVDHTIYDNPKDGATFIHAQRQKGEGRPTKRDRREIDRLKGD